MQVDIWSDVVCPWCYVGKARFEKALAGFGGRDDVEVVYRSFELDPSWPKGDHMPVLTMLSRKYGMSEAQARAAEGRVAALAAAEGLGFDADRENGNSFDVHRVIQYGRAVGIQRDLLTAVNQAYFAEARPVFDPAVLTEVAVGAGADAVAVRDVLDSGVYSGAVRDDERAAADLGISAVPFFLFDGKVGVSGAQPTPTFTAALQQVS
jgi:predicted DsbA family dithiol-disulfide isomerase